MGLGSHHFTTNVLKIKKPSSPDIQSFLGQCGIGLSHGPGIPQTRTFKLIFRFILLLMPNRKEKKIILSDWKRIANLFVVEAKVS